MVLTQKMAERFFGDEDPIGKVLSVSDPYFEGDYQAFNVGSGIGTSIEHIALTLSNILGTEHLSPDITGTYRQGDIRHSIADISRIKKTLGFKPSVSFQHGMEELVEWGRDREVIDGFAKAQDALQQKGLVALPIIW